MKFVEGNWLFKENVHKNEVFQNKCINQQKYAFSFSYRHSRMSTVALRNSQQNARAIYQTARSICIRATVEQENIPESHAETQNRNKRRV